MARSFAQQKAALTRALNIADPDERCTKVEREVLRVVDEWNSGQGQFTGGWPDDWSRWYRALQDVGSRQVM